MEIPFAESWKIKMVEPIRKSTRAEREEWLKAANYNVFQLRAEQVYIDCLTDSGTGSMSDRQWSAMMLGDESYAGATSFYKFEETVRRILGLHYVIPTHQGRAAENVLFSFLVKEGNVIPGNAHFDTTKGHIEARKAFAIDVTTDDAKDAQLEVPFKGNVSLEKLEKVLKENPGNVPFMVLTVTNNTVYGRQGSTLSYSVNIIGLYKAAGTIWMQGKKSRSEEKRYSIWNDGKTYYKVDKDKKKVEIYRANDPERDKYSEMFNFDADNFVYSVKAAGNTFVVSLDAKEGVKGIKHIKAIIDKKTRAPLSLRLKFGIIWVTVKITHFKSGGISASTFAFPKHRYHNYKVIDNR